MNEMLIRVDMSGGATTGLSTWRRGITKDTVVEGPTVRLASGGMRVGLYAIDDGVDEFARNLELRTRIRDEEYAIES